MAIYFCTEFCVTVEVDGVQHSLSLEDSHHRGGAGRDDQTFVYQAKDGKIIWQCTPEEFFRRFIIGK